jgi:hypothetical protein
MREQKYLLKKIWKNNRILECERLNLESESSTWNSPFRYDRSCKRSEWGEDEQRATKRRNQGRHDQASRTTSNEQTNFSTNGRRNEWMRVTFLYIGWLIWLANMFIGIYTNDQLVHTACNDEICCSESVAMGWNYLCTGKTDKAYTTTDDIQEDPSVFHWSELATSD